MAESSRESHATKQEGDARTGRLARWLPRSTEAQTSLVCQCVVGTTAVICATVVFRGDSPLWGVAPLVFAVVASLIIKWTTPASPSDGTPKTSGD